MIDDIKMTAMARKTVIKNRFDISRIRIRVTRGVIHVSGRFQRLTGSPSEREGDETSLRKLDEDLHGLSGMRGVHYQIENWMYEPSGSWQKMGPKMSKSAAKALEQGNDIG
jgi:hypothetical protein